jgi:hypothetical protein
LARVINGLFPHLAVEGVMSEWLDVLAEPFSVEVFDCFDDPRVELAPPLVEHVPVSHLVRQGMLEGVFGSREQTLLIQEVGRL